MSLSGQNKRPLGFSAAEAIASALLFICLSVFGLRVYAGLSGMTFADEADHVLGVKVLKEGGTLYGSYVDQHGPLIFILGQIWDALGGSVSPISVRLVMAVLALFCMALIASALHSEKKLNGLLGLSLFSGSLASVWLMQGLYQFSYYPLAGFLAVLMIAAGLTAFWKNGRTSSRAEIFCVGLCAAGLCLTSYSYGPSAVFLSVAVLCATVAHQRRSVFLCGLAGAGTGLLAGLIWIMIWGSLKGWLAFHLYYNQVVYAPFIHFTPMTFLEGMRPSLLPERWPGTLVQLLLVLCCVLLFFRIRKGRPEGRTTGAVIAVVCLFAGIELLNARGETGFKAGAQLVAVCGLAALTLPAAISALCTRLRLPHVLAVAGVAGFLVGTEFLIRQTPSSPFQWSWEKMTSLPEINPYTRAKWPVFARIRELARPDERILVLPFAPELYLAADRLPIDRYYEYLPWDQVYAQKPFPGEERNICADLPRLRPEVIVYRPWKTDLYPPERYLGCILSLLSTDYREEPGFLGVYALIRKN